jgi:uncharacterized lipoprotein NlpE involved in copper resistance
MKKSYTLHAILFAFFFTSCGEPSSSTTGEDGESLIQKQSAAANGPASETLNTMNSGEMTGTYSGVLPCGDCDGIKTSLSLKDDDTFILNREYLGSEATNLQVAGNYEYDEQSQMITLENPADGPSKFLMLNGELWQLDKNSNRIEGDLADKYVLIKNFE